MCCLTKLIDWKSESLNRALTEWLVFLWLNSKYTRFGPQTVGNVWLPSSPLPLRYDLLIKLHGASKCAEWLVGKGARSSQITFLSNPRGIESRRSFLLYGETSLLHLRTLNVNKQHEYLSYGLWTLTFSERESWGLLKCTGCFRAKMHMLLDMLLTSAKWLMITSLDWKSLGDTLLCHVTSLPILLRTCQEN